MESNFAAKNRFFAEPMKITSENPFCDDVLGRKPIAENLTKLVSTFSDMPFALAVNGPWGSGKTKFVEMWQAYLRQNGFRTLHFNAWENDHADDPFAAILTQFRQLTEATQEGTQTKGSKLWNDLANKSIPILKRAAAGVAKNLTLGILDLKSGEAEEIIAALAEESAKDALERCADAQKSIKTFRTELEAYVHDESTGGKPVIYFVDELDRCRPTFAISVLERIKHLLSVPGVVFVFAWDRQQLDNTVRSIYGEATDTGGYLVRFVDLEFSLPNGDNRSLCQALLKRFGLLDFLFSRQLKEVVSEIIKTFPAYATQYSLSIREQERVFTALSILCRIRVPLGSFTIKFVIFLLIARLRLPKLFLKIGKPGIYFDDLVQRELPEALGEDFWSSSEGGMIEGLFIYELKTDTRRNLISALQSKLKSHEASQRENMVFEGYLCAQNNRHEMSISALLEQMQFVAAFYND